MIDETKLIRFDWAAKRILRDKANFGVLEGLITVLLDEPVKIVELLESEGNQDNVHDKFNRVDIKATNSKGELIIVEIQQTHEYYFLERILYAASKAITEHVELGHHYDQVRKVYSINIIYFNLGQGKDYLYHGTTVFKGVHTGDTLEIDPEGDNALRLRTPEEIFPEYYLIRVNEFNKVATTPLEEWVNYLKNGLIRDDTTAPGLQEVREKLQYIKMSPKEQRAYEQHLDDIRYNDSVFMMAHLEGKAIGMARGKAQGRAEGKELGEKAKALEVARNLKALGMDEEIILKVTGLTTDEKRDDA